MLWSARSVVAASVATPVAAKQVRLLCPHCNNSVYVVLPYRPTVLRRQQLIREAIDEHRRLCVKAPSEAGRVFRIDYPRV